MKNHFLHGLAKLCLIAYAFLAHSYTAHGQNHHLTEYDSLMPYTTSGRLLERSTLALSSGGAWYKPDKASCFDQKTKTMKNNFNFFKLFSFNTPLESLANRVNNENRERINTTWYRIKFRTNDFLTDI